jgi:hypothetical protein
MPVFRDFFLPDSLKIIINIRYDSVPTVLFFKMSIDELNPSRTESEALK